MQAQVHRLGGEIDLVGGGILPQSDPVKLEMLVLGGHLDEQRPAAQQQRGGDHLIHVVPDQGQRDAAAVGAARHVDGEFAVFIRFRKGGVRFAVNRRRGVRIQADGGDRHAGEERGRLLGILRSDPGGGGVLDIDPLGADLTGYHRTPRAVHRAQVIGHLHVLVVHGDGPGVSDVEIVAAVVIPDPFVLGFQQPKAGAVLFLPLLRRGPEGEHLAGHQIPEGVTAVPVVRKGDLVLTGIGITDLIARQIGGLLLRDAGAQLGPAEVQRDVVLYKDGLDGHTVGEHDPLPRRNSLHGAVCPGDLDTVAVIALLCLRGHVQLVALRPGESVPASGQRHVVADRAADAQRTHIRIVSGDGDGVDLPADDHGRQQICDVVDPLIGRHHGILLIMDSAEIVHVSESGKRVRVPQSAPHVALVSLVIRETTGIGVVARRVSVKAVGIDAPSAAFVARVQGIVDRLVHVDGLRHRYRAGCIADGFIRLTESVIGLIGGGNGHARGVLVSVFIDAADPCELVQRRRRIRVVHAQADLDGVQTDLLDLRADDRLIVVYKTPKIR